MFWWTGTDPRSGKEDIDRLLLGASGSSLALILYLHHKQRDGGDVPGKIVVTTCLFLGPAHQRVILADYLGSGLINRLVCSKEFLCILT
jgi:hypothetical protein